MTPRLEDAPGLTLAVTSGRSCHGYAPYLFVEEADGAWRFYAVCWPGNWRFTFTMEGEALFSMDRDMLQGELAPGERLPLPVVLTAYCPRGREQLCQDVRAYLRQTLPLSRMDCGLVSWNHWWRYEDAGDRRGHRAGQRPRRRGIGGQPHRAGRGLVRGRGAGSPTGPGSGGTGSR